MKNKWILVGLILVFCLLAGTVGSSQAQGTEPPEEGAAITSESSIEDNLDNIIPIQGKLSTVSGNPVPDGNYSITASLYSVEHGGTALCTDTQTITVMKGLFTMNVDNCTNEDIHGQQLYLGIKIGSDAEMTPRQPIYPVPYAFSLKPGATIDFSTLFMAGDYVDLQGSIGSSISWWLGYSYALLPNGRANFGLKTSVTSGNIAYGISSSAETSAAEGDAYGVYGYANATGTNAMSYGVYGNADSIDGFGVVGVQTGYNPSDLPSVKWKSGGLFGGRNGVIGITKANNGNALYALDNSTGGGWAGVFDSNNGNGVNITTPSGKTGLVVYGGTKNAAVNTDEGSRLLYTEESTEVWFSDYGFGKLDGDKAIITIDPLFAQTVNLNEPYHVFIQVYGDAEVYVSNRTPTQFEVHLHDGEPNIEFSYRIVAVRLGYEGNRLEAAPDLDAQERLEQSDSSNP